MSKNLSEIKANKTFRNLLRCGDPENNVKKKI